MTERPVSVSLALQSASRAQDAGYLALADISILAAHLAADYRVVGGHMVSLLAEAYQVSGVPTRETADADFGAAASVVADQALLTALDQRAYRQVAGNRFERTIDSASDDTVNLTIDVLVPSYSGRHVPNQEVGVLVVDAIPGLSLALARPAMSIDVTLHLREPALAGQAGLPTTFTILVPDALGALVVKALAWASRKADRDAVDVWRLLEVGAAAGLTPGDWVDTGACGDARRALNDSFGRRNASGTTAATPDMASRLRIASLVQQHVGRPARDG